MDELNQAEGPPELEDRILPWSQVKVISGLSRTTVWRLQKTGDFPASVQVSRNRIGWWQSEILEWRRSRIPRRLPKPPVAKATELPSRGAPQPVERPRPVEGLRSIRRRRKPPDPSPAQGAFDF